MADKNGSPPAASAHERVDAEIIVGRSTVSLTIVGIEISCAEEILAAVVSNLLNEHQRDKRQEHAMVPA